MEASLEMVDKNVLDLSKSRKSSTGAVREFRNRLNTIGQDQIGYELDLLTSFARKLVSSALIMPTLIIVIAFISLMSKTYMMTGLWACIAILGCILTTYLAKKFLAEPRDKKDVSKWSNIFLGANLVLAAAWSIFASIDCTGCNNSEFNIIQFTSLLLFQGVLTSLMYHSPKHMLVIAGPASLILSVRFLLSQEITMVMMGTIVLVSLIFFFVIATRFKQSVLEMLTLATDKEMLILELETTKADSEGARKRAEDANLAKSRFLATMSHELRTPLNAILGFSEIMRDEVMGPIGNENYKSYTNDIFNSGSHLLNLINEILDLSRIEAGRQELNEEHVMLSETVDSARHLMEVKARQKDIELICKYEANLPPIWVDERAMRQVALNLISNALKFTPNGGKITLKVGWTAKGGQYFSVSDTGPGIPEEEIPIVLSSFGQGTIAIKDAEPGTGLGLSIVQALLKLHNGSFDIKSELRVGTDAICYLPKNRVATENNIRMPMESEVA